MKIQTLPLSIAIVLSLAACKKDKDDPVPPGATGNTACGIPGARLQATFNNATWCPNINLFASMSDILTISGMTSAGSTLTLELDSVAPGTHAMGEESNSIFFTTEMALGYRTSDDQPAVLVITEHDPGTQRIKGTFNGELFPLLGGPSRTISGSFDMIYVE